MLRCYSQPLRRRGAVSQLCLCLEKATIVHSMRKGGIRFHKIIVKIAAFSRRRKAQTIR